MDIQTPSLPVPSSITLDQGERIIALLIKIERRLNPPLWKKIVAFTFNHAITIISLITLAYVTWQIWSIVTGVQSQMANIIGTLGKVKFW